MILKEPTEAFKRSLEILVIDQSDINFAWSIAHNPDVLYKMIEDLHRDLPRVFTRIIDESYNYVYVAESSVTNEVVGLIEKSVLFADQSFFYAVAPFYHAALSQWLFNDDKIMRRIKENDEKSMTELQAMLLKEAKEKTGKFFLEIRGISQKLISMSSRFESLAHSTLNNILVLYQEVEAKPSEEVIIK